MQDVKDAMPEYTSSSHIYIQSSGLRTEAAGNPAKVKRWMCHFESGQTVPSFTGTEVCGPDYDACVKMVR